MEFLDECVVYAFIRQDVSIENQIVQILHAQREATKTYVLQNLDSPKLNGIPYLTTVGMPDAKSFNKLIAKLEKAEVKYTTFHDTDYDFGVVGIITEPMPLSVREKPDGLMCNYRLWNPVNNTFVTPVVMSAKIAGPA